MYRLTFDSSDLPLNADGALALQIKPELLALIRSGKHFTRDVTHGSGNVLQGEVELTEEGTLRLGGTDRLGLSVSAGARCALDLVWPDEDPHPLLEAHGLTGGAGSVGDGSPAAGDGVGDGGSEGAAPCYLVLTLDGDAEVGAEVARTGTQYALSGSIGLRTGAALHFTRAVPFASDMPARTALESVVRGLRLPQDIRTVDDLPDPGEVLSLRYGGYLNLAMDAAWGYDVKKFVEKETGDVRLAGTVAVTAQSELCMTCGIAGEFAFEVSRAPDRPEWARLVVRKDQRRSAQGALDLAVGVAASEEEPLPEDAMTFVAALLGVSIPDQVAEMRELIADPEALLSRLKGETGELTEKAVRTLFDRWYPNEAVEEKVGPFTNKLESVLNQYDTLAAESDRWVGVLSSFTAEELREARDRIGALQDRSQLAHISHPILLRVLRAAAGDQYGRMVTGEAAFDEQKALIEETLTELLEDGKKELVDLFGLTDGVLSVERVIANLRRFDTPQELKEEAETYLVDFASRLAGKAFDALADEAELEEAFEELNRTLDRLERMTGGLYEKFKAALGRQYRLRLGRSYARATDKESLLDVRIDLAHPEGGAAMADALEGELAGLMSRSAGEYVEIAAGRFVDTTTTASRLSINVLNWNLEHVRELILRHEKSVREEGDGLLHVYRLSGRETEVRSSARESMELTFLAGLLAEGRAQTDRREDLVDTVRKLTMEYGFMVEDRRVTETEMRSYIELARYLEMLPAGSQTYLDELRTDLGMQQGDSWGTVTINYRVRYEPGLLLDLFEAYTESNEETVQSIFRRVTAANFLTSSRRIGAGSRAALSHRRLAAHLVQPSTYRAFQDSALEGHIGDKLAERNLEVLFLLEEDLLKVLSDLNEVVTARSVSRSRLDRAFRRLVKMRNRLEGMLEPDRQDRLVNPFFVILDRLLAFKFPTKADRRDSYAELIVDRGGAEMVRVLTDARTDLG